MFAEYERLPGSPQLHRWADWAELVCFMEGQLSVPDLSSGIEARTDDMPIELSDDCEPDVLRDDSLASRPEAVDEFRDKINSRSKDIFNYLLSRADYYGDSYPLEFNATTRLFMPRAPRQNRLLYLFLLACSSLRYIAKRSDRVRLANMFEGLCLVALKSELPTRAEVHQFGANASESRYGSKLADKISILAKDLREQVLINVEDEEEFAPGDHGDGGLDLVGWVPSKDSSPGLLTVFGQCACTPEWVQKQHSSSVSAWEAIFRFTVDPVNFCFIPFDFRRIDGDWYSRRSIHNTVVIDRRRIIEALGDVDSSGIMTEIDIDTIVDTKLIEGAFYL